MENREEHYISVPRAEYEEMESNFRYQKEELRKWEDNPERVVKIHESTSFSVFALVFAIGWFLGVVMTIVINK